MLADEALYPVLNPHFTDHLSIPLETPTDGADRYHKIRSPVKM
jgi:hypothetical protein